MKENLLDKLNRKYGRHSIRNLMNYIVGGMAVVYLMELFIYPMTHLLLSSILAFDRSAIFHGQIWRLFTFIFIPPNSNLLFIIFALYFYWLIGNSLENQWGSFRFNVYYFCGVIGTLLAGLFTGYATHYYLNLSLFLAFALMYSGYHVLLFFFWSGLMRYMLMIDSIVRVFMLIIFSY